MPYKPISRASNNKERKPRPGTAATCGSSPFVMVNDETKFRGGSGKLGVMSLNVQVTSYDPSARLPASTVRT